MDLFSSTLPRQGLFDQTSCWLGWCTGYRVRTARGTSLGIVRSTQPSGSASPQALEISGDPGSETSVVIPVALVATIEPEREVVTLVSSELETQEASLDEVRIDDPRTTMQLKEVM